MATNTAGLHERPTYNKLIREIQQGEKIKLPNRDALFLRNSPYLAFLDGQGTTEMAAQQEKKQKQDDIEHLVREQASNGDKGAAELRIGQKIKAGASNVSQLLMGSGGGGHADMDDIVDETAGQPQGTGGGGGSAQGPWRGGGNLVEVSKGKFPSKPGFKTVKQKAKKHYTEEYFIGDQAEEGASSSSSKSPMHLANIPYANQMVMQVLGAHDAKLDRRSAMLADMIVQSQHALFQQFNSQRAIDPVVALMGNQPSTALALATSTMPIRTPAPIPTAERQVVPTLNITPDPPKGIITMIPKAGAIAPYRPVKPKKAFDAPAKAFDQDKRAGVVDNETGKKLKNIKGLETPVIGIREEPKPSRAKSIGIKSEITPLDPEKTKKHWQKATLQDITKKLQMQGAKLKPSQFTGPNPLRKGDLLKLLYKRNKDMQ